MLKQNANFTNSLEQFAIRHFDVSGKSSGTPAPALAPAPSSGGPSPVADVAYGLEKPTAAAAPTADAPAGEHISVEDGGPAQGLVPDPPDTLREEDGGIRSDVAVAEPTAHSDSLDFCAHSPLAPSKPSAARL